MILALLALLATIAPHPLFTGPELDYQASITVAPDGALVVVFERLHPSTLSGDLFVTRSGDGSAWTEPRAIVQTASNERAPSLVATPTGYVLFYLGETSPGAYRVFRATSADAETWTLHGPIDLGWPTPGEINPDVIREADGSLTMTYHRLGGGSYLARSFDDGATWDTRQTRIAPGTTALPRVAKRESDGTYLVTYQLNPGTGRLQMYAKTSKDPYDWSGDPVPLSVDGNSHDSDPRVLPNGRFVVVYADQRGASLFNLFLRTSEDGRTWSAATQLTSGPTLNDVQPHLADIDGGVLALVWSRQKGSQSDRDLWIDALHLRTKRRSVRSGG